MDENNDKNVVYEIKNENNSSFKTVKDPNYYKNYEKKSNNKSTTSFTKSILVPFVSGIVGCAVVIGTCFGVPSIRSSILGIENINNSANSSEVTGYVSQTSLSNYSDTAVYAANKILPSIVGITVEYNVNSMFSMFGGNSQSTSAKASGSGIIISDDGYILTNNHIVATSSSNDFYEVSAATKVTVKLFNDETEYEAKIIGTDEQTDLAVIKIEKTDLPKAEFADSDNIKVGEFAMAVGNPLGLESTITCGVISAVNRQITDSDGTSYTLIQTDAAINSGNSGGALVNSQGQVIGINTLKLEGTGIEGMGFAIPINSTKDITSQLIEYSKVRRPYIGITGMDLDEKTAKANGLVVGIYVKSIEDFSAAEKAGVKPGDVIVKADGKNIKTMDELNEIKNSHQIGDQMTITVNRNGQERDLTITLDEQP